MSFGLFGGREQHLSRIRGPELSHGMIKKVLGQMIAGEPLLNAGRASAPKHPVYFEERVFRSLNSGRWAAGPRPCATLPECLVSGTYEREFRTHSSVSTGPWMRFYWRKMDSGAQQSFAEKCDPLRAFENAGPTARAHVDRAFRRQLA